VTRACTAALLLFVAGCASTSGDSFAVAQAAMRRDDLLAALLAYDAVPVSHPRYPEACAGAAAVEVRLRRGQELMLEGFAQRAEYEDAKALQYLEQARDVWPGLPGVEVMIASTRHRLQRAGVRPDRADHVPIRIPLRAAESTELTAADHTLTGDTGAAAPAEGLRQVPLEPADESIVLGLVAVETRLGRGELELAVVDLLELARRFPDDVRVQRRLARVLHQRALLRYGQGALTAALLDWERVLSIEPDNRGVAGLLQAVRAEAATPAAPR
jgi:tetratricopeptide (TPR) repeat protein